MPSIRSVVRLIVLAVVGYVGYEVVNAYLRHRHTTAGPAGRGEVPVLGPTGRLGADKIEPLGKVGGAAMTGGGEGIVADVGDDTALPTATRVGRGVIRRNAN